MSRKDLIKSRLNVSQQIKNQLSSCLGSFLAHKKTQNPSPFQISGFNIQSMKQPVKHKKSLPDWRFMYSEKKLTKFSQSWTNQLSNKQKIKRPQSCSLSFAQNIPQAKRSPTAPEKAIRKTYSAFSQNKQKRNVSPFDPKLTPFIMVQNLYENSVNNFETQKRVQTARIRQYYQRKAEKVEQFKEYERLQSKINQNTQEGHILLLQTRDNLNSGMNIKKSKGDKVPIYQRKSKRIADPSEYFKDFNKVRIPQKFVFKQYSVETKQ